MSYEQAPATIMLATHCVCCGRPLVDSVSVEAGIGPECRKKHGFQEPQRAPDWSKVVLTSPIPMEGTPQEMCNKLVWLAARKPSTKDLCRMVDTIRALGFDRLAKCLAKRTADAVVTVENGHIHVKCAYNETFVAEGRHIPGRRWDGPSKTTIFPQTAREQLWGVLKRSFPGGVLDTPKGMVVLS